jgi:hypothetical protein
MKIRYFALVVGIIFVLLGFLGFEPAVVSHPASAPVIAAKTSYGYLFGVFPINIWHNLVHILVGFLGIIAYPSRASARLYARGLAIFYAILAILGYIPATSTLFGLIPIFGYDVWLHAIIAAVAAYFGYFVPRHLHTSQAT